jgi:FkbM family methyltransferase
VTQTIAGRVPVPSARKVTRSVLVHFPRVYSALTSQWRYRVYHRLGMVHEREFRALPLLVSRPDPVVLDVGGNDGQSILSIKSVLPDARVTTFEPAPSHLPQLRALASKMRGVDIEVCALSDADGQAELFWPVYRGMVMHALASLDRDEVMSWLGPAGIYGYDPGQLRIETAVVTMRRLDDFGLNPDIVKIDVQGTEARVLAGGMATIERCRPVVMAEELAEGSAAHRLLAPLGYDVYTFSSGGFHAGSSLPATNRFLIPSERTLVAA